MYSFWYQKEGVAHAAPSPVCLLKKNSSMIFGRNFMENNIIVSICMIVKNEQRCLERCLKSLTPLRKQIPCEVIITDTGSTDNTLEIAKKYADKILHFEWCNDFSAARNVGMEQAKGEWILVLDADEELAEDVSHLVSFFKSEERHQYMGAFLTKMNCFNAEICSQCESLREYTGITSSFLDYRLFRADLKPRYAGIIHEYVPYREPVYTFGLTLYHDGYAYEDKEKRKEKGLRNASLLEKQLKSNLRDLRVIVHTMREREVIKEDIYENLVLLEEDVVYKNLKSGYAPAALIQVASYYYDKKELEKALKICKDFLKFFDNERYEVLQIDIRYIQSNCLFQQKQYTPAVKMIERYLQVVEKYQKNQLNLDALRTTTLKFGNAAPFMKYIQIRCYMEGKNIKQAESVLKSVAMEKLREPIFFNYYWIIVTLSLMPESEISLKEYYPILLNALERKNEEDKKTAQKTYDMVHSYIAKLPVEKRGILLEQISSSEQGQKDLWEFIHKKEQEKEQKLKKVIEDTKVTIQKLIAEPTMQENALDLCQKLLEIAPEDEQIKAWIKELKE